MKKHCTKAKTNRILNKLGMTYVELLCALSLLMLIVVMFTPMLLSSYETLYKAGERVEDAYSSKEEIEDTLATRLEENLLTFSDFKLEDNAAKALYNVEITGKKIVSSLTHGLETVFGVARARVNIVSPSIVYDDQDNHNVIIQVKGLKYNNVTFGKYTEGSTLIQNGKPKKGTIHIEVIVPEKKDVASEANAYKSTGLAKVEVKTGIKNKEIVYGDPAKVEFSDTKDNGRIYLKISSGSATPLDFTQSPVRIRVYYVDNRDKIKNTSAYLTIEPPTMIFAGEANDSVDYYTSAGVVEKNGVYKLEVNPRKMRLANSGYLTEGTDNPGKAGIAINTVTWVDSDTNSKLQPYYVMAGTNSRVYRMYNYNVGGSITGAFTLSNASSVIDTTDSAVVLTDGTVATQSFWSGEMSDQYSFKTMEHATSYGKADYLGVDCTAAYNRVHKIESIMGIGGEDLNQYHVGTRYNYFDKTLRYSMQFAGFNSDYDYQHLANRRISYVLTEVGDGKSFRLGGKLKVQEEFNAYSYPWEPEEEFYIGEGLGLCFDKKLIGSGYRDYNPLIVTRDNRIVAGVSDSNSKLYAWQEDPYDGPAYFQGEGSGGENDHWDRNFAYIRIKSMTTINPVAETMKGSDSNIYTTYFSQGDFWVNRGNDNELKDGNVPPREPAGGFISQDTANCVNVTSSVYLPEAGSDGEGQVIYLGVVPAYAFLRQSSDIGRNDAEALHVYNGKRVKDSRATGYVISSNDDAKGSQVFRAFSSTDNNTSVVSDKFKFLSLAAGGQATGDYSVPALTDKNPTKEITLNQARYNFYTDTSDDVIFYDDNDLRFTFGYCSRWRMAIGDVTSDGITEETRSYEKYYKFSNPDADYYLDRTKTLDKENPTLNKQGGTDNLYYNVWFPGEFYNLTQAATCDEVTVAVGYAVSGSAFMKESDAKDGDGNRVGTGFYGTALGSVYNDGVMAAYVSEDAGGRVLDGSITDTSLDNKGERNTIFENVLYYKTPEFLDSTLHSRKSVRFTAVDLYTVAPELKKPGSDSGIATVADIDEEKEYYAVYGDSTGRAFYSKIATSTVTGDSQVEGSAEEHVTLCTGANAVPAKPTTTFKNGTNGMCEIKVNGQSLSTIYSEIKTIAVENDIMIITGVQLNSDTAEQIVIGTRDSDDTNEWTFKVVYNGYTFKDVINSSNIIGNYYYICGNKWVAAVSLDALKEIDNNGRITNVSETDTSKSYKSTSKNDLLWVSTATKIYAVDGRDTKG